MIARLIEWCARNRFLVFTGVFLLVLAGIWSMKNIPLDALPDISDVQVIIHTGWEGQPPNIIEDQVTYPIVTTMLAAPRVKNVRAETMFGDSYVYVIFQDGTDLYWARSRVLEYLQQLHEELDEAALAAALATQRRRGRGALLDPAGLDGDLLAERADVDELGALGRSEARGALAHQKRPLTHRALPGCRDFRDPHPAPSVARLA